jgi:hypothetical protein
VIPGLGCGVNEMVNIIVTVQHIGPVFKDQVTKHNSMTSIISEEQKKSHGFYTLNLGADKSLARYTSRCILFDGENISFDASLVI